MKRTLAHGDSEEIEFHNIVEEITTCREKWEGRSWMYVAEGPMNFKLTGRTWGETKETMEEEYETECDITLSSQWRQEHEDILETSNPPTFIYKIWHFKKVYEDIALHKIS
jgi:hypothetical protein